MSDTSAPEVTSAHPKADKVFAYLAALLVLAIIVQFFLAGLGVWGIDQRKLDKATSLDPHRAVADLIALIALIMFITALVARAGKTKVWVSITIAVLAALVQSLLAAGGEHQHWVGGLHVLDGLVILGLAGWMHSSTRHLIMKR